jgi:phenylacetate-coenzyme A ligase PaaK-like adenylate-forming protein
MSVALLIKNKFDRLPPNLGKILARIPFQYRPGIGSIYKNRKIEIAEFEDMHTLAKNRFIFEKTYKLVEFSLNNVPFYKEYYAKNGFQLSDLNSYEDLHKIPIINKSILQEYSIEKRTSAISDKYLVNTGGSSGKPLSFFIQPTSMGHEWAHMHTIWAKLGYRPHDLKLAFGGRSDVKDFLQYDSVRHHFSVDIYADFSLIAKKLKTVLKKNNIYFLHGYPSAIYEFAINCESFDRELPGLLSKNLKGIFIGSEYPIPLYRDKIEEVFGVGSVSWYGHTERAVLAYEKFEKFEYWPFQTYGFAEAVQDGNGKFNLIGTSYYNYASPLIKYNTEDEIEPIFNDGLLRTFTINDGRKGEFILDRNRKRISLTGLIFGRHHKLFEYCSFIQLKQEAPGEALVLITPNNRTDEVMDFQDLFDSENVEIEFQFKKISEPIRTQSGKVNLFIRS